MGNTRILGTGYWDKDPKRWEKARKEGRKYPKLRVSHFKFSQTAASDEKPRKKFPFYLPVSLILKIREFLLCKFSLMSVLLCELNWLLLPGLGAQVSTRYNIVSVENCVQISDLQRKFRNITYICQAGTP